MFTSSSKNPACNLPQGHGEAENGSLRKKQGARNNCDSEKGQQPLSEGHILHLRESQSSREMGLQGNAEEAVWGEEDRYHMEKKNQEWKRRLGERGRSDRKRR